MLVLSRKQGESVVIGNDKLGALEVYDLDGKRIQRISEGFFGNVDVRQAVDIGGSRVDLVVTYRKGIRVYTMDPSSRQLSNSTAHWAIRLRTSSESSGPEPSLPSCRQRS